MAPVPQPGFVARAAPPKVTLKMTAIHEILTRYDIKVHLFLVVVWIALRTGLSKIAAVWSIMTVSPPVSNRLCLRRSLVNIL